MEDGILTVGGTSSARLEEKRSVFLALIFPCAGVADFSTRLASTKDEHPEARHFLTAYRLSGGREQASENREPVKSAHQILEILRRRELVDIGVIIVRYFGGTLLGAARLERTYLNAFTAALRQAEIYRVIKVKPLRLLLTHRDYERLKSSADDGFVIVEAAFKGPTVELKVAGTEAAEQLDRLGLTFEEVDGEYEFAQRVQLTV